MARSCLLLILGGVLVLAAGCATRQVVSQWSNPDYSGHYRFKRVLVVGVTDNTAIRRNFEDALVAKLRAAQIDALPSYRFIAESGKVGEERFNEAVRRSSAESVIITRLLRIEQRTEARPSYFDGGFPPVGLYGAYSSAWHGGFYASPWLYQYPVFYSETSLIDVAKDDVVWSATIRTVDPRDAEDAISEYVDTVVNALRKTNLLGARSEVEGRRFAGEYP